MTTLPHYFYFISLIFSLESITLDYATATISISTVSMGPIFASSFTSDFCGKIIVREEQAYHVSTQDKYQSWNKSQLSESTSKIDITTQLSSLVREVTTSILIDFAVDMEETSLLFVQTTNKKDYFMTYQINSDHNTTYDAYLIYHPNTPAQTFVKGQIAYQFYPTINPIVIVRNLTSNVIKNTIPDNNPLLIGMQVSPNYQYAIIWNAQTNCSIYSLGNSSLVGVHTPTITSNSTVTNTITFSSDSAFAIIETDQFNPIIVLNITNNNFSIAYSVPINDTIIEAHFLDVTNTVLVVFCLNSVTFVDLISNQQYITPPITATAYAADYYNNIFTCYNNTMTQKSIIFTRKEALTYPQSNDKIFKMINGTLAVVTDATYLLTNIASSTSISFYFLGFLNYITTCSLYILLNFQIPQQVYSYLTLLHSKISVNPFQILFPSLSVLPLSDQQVYEEKLQHFGVTSDLFSGNYSNFALFLLNLLLVVVVEYAIWCLSDDKQILTQVSKEKKNIIYGQVINLFQLLVLPWACIFLRQGITRVGTKLNEVVYYGLMFGCLFFTVYYLFALLRNRRQVQSIELQDNQKTLTRKTNNSIMNQEEKQLQNRQSNVLFEVADEWLLCVTNIVFPLLVVLDNVVIFLAFISFYDVVGVFVSYNIEKMRINRTILSIYPLIFHICFLIFYWCNTPAIIYITEIICLMSLCAGFCHNILTVVFLIFQTLIRFVSFIFTKSNKIQPMNSKSLINNETQKQKKHQNIISQNYKSTKTEKMLTGKKQQKKHHNTNLHTTKILFFTTKMIHSNGGDKQLPLFYETKKIDSKIEQKQQKPSRKGSTKATIIKRDKQRMKTSNLKNEKTQQQNMNLFIKQLINKRLHHDI